MSKKQYLLFDGRWFDDPDSALVLCTSMGIKEALDDYKLFPQDTVIVDHRDIAVYCKDAKLDLTKGLP